jgi:hypothetical protein
MPLKRLQAIQERAKQGIESFASLEVALAHLMVLAGAYLKRPPQVNWLFGPPRNLTEPQPPSPRGPPAQYVESSQESPDGRSLVAFHASDPTLHALPLPDTDSRHKSLRTGSRDPRGACASIR